MLSIVLFGMMPILKTLVMSPLFTLLSLPILIGLSLVIDLMWDLLIIPFNLIMSLSAGYVALLMSVNCASHND